MSSSQASSPNDPLQPSSPSQERVVSWKITQCLNPDCLHSNPNTIDICQRCESKLLLGERYRATRSIGAGGFACTFAAIDEQRLQTPCVIKQFLPRQQNSQVLQTSLNLFQQEARILRDLGSHPQIPSLLAFLEQDDRFYLVQEFINGQSLFEVLTTQGAFSEPEVQKIFKELLPILQFVHKRQVIHRDIKLSNILRQADQTLVLIDFGGSMETSANFRSITGTPGYAAPEQLRGKVCPASDLYSLGVIGLRLLTATLPQEDGSDPLFDIEHQQWHLPSSISPNFRKILARLLEPNVADRYASATAVLEDLDQVTPVPQRIREQTLLPMEPAPQQYNQLKSEVGLDYRPLRDLLADENYRQADQFTWYLMLQASDRQAEGCLNLQALRQFPQVDLATLDQLWQAFSQGKFGFSIQKEIYQNLGGNFNPDQPASFDFPLWLAFGQQVGWQIDQQWIHYSRLSFRTQAPRGSFPACFADPLNRTGFARGVCGWWRLGFVTLMERLEAPWSEPNTWF